MLRSCWRLHVVENLARRPVRRHFSGSNVTRAGSALAACDAHTESPWTIFAPATPPGKSAISILRISGPEVRQVWDSTRSKKKLSTQPWPPTPRKVFLRAILSPTTQEKLDEGLVIYFPAVSSLTAQDMLELHLHGSTAVLKAVLSSLSQLKGFRPAEPGEFTRLAFDNGRMDLTEVEGLRDLIESETEVQRKQAVQQAGGHMRVAYDAMREKIISAMSVLEAMIDFGEDESIHEEEYFPAREKITELRDLIVRQLEQAERGEIVRTGARIAIYGAPNAGKSSLMNWFAQRDASIVTDIPGTTRDVVNVTLDFHGYPIILSDTAGLRITTDKVEEIGIARARQAMAEAHVRICVVSLPEAIEKDDAAIDGLASTSLPPETTLYFFNKVDATSSESVEKLLQRFHAAHPTARVHAGSLLTGEGIADLVSTLKSELASTFESYVGSGEALLVTRERHRHHLGECLQCLQTFLDIDPSVDLVGAAEELRYAAEALGKVTGRVRVDDILDELFSTFCIGK